MIRAFAAEGVVCAVLAPVSAQDGDAKVQATRAAERADIVVLDWFIHETAAGGETTKAVIQGILDHDEQAGGRLRLIAIYTGEPVLSTIADVLETMLSARGLLVQRDGLTLQSGSLRIIVLMKGDGEDRAYDAASEQPSVTESQLPAALFAAFVRLTSGLISNAAVHSLAVLRDNTHALLANLDERLDAAFLTHRICQPEPEDASLHLEELIASEIGAMLSGFEVGSIAGGENVAKWVRSRDGFRHPSADKMLDVDDVVRLARDGDLSAVQGIKKKSATKELTKILQRPAHVSYDADAAYAVATSMVRRYGRQPAPVLSAGTVIRQEFAPNADSGAVTPPASSDAATVSGAGRPAEAEREYLVCVQPVCDSVRVGAGRPFLFVPAAAVQGSEVFDLVLENSPRAFVRLKLTSKVFLIRSIDFRGRDGEEVIRAAESVDGTFVFVTASGLRYMWIAQMKMAYAQRLLQRVGSELSRVGLNESEWLRISSGG